MDFSWKYNKQNRPRRLKYEKEYNAKRPKLSDKRGESKQDTDRNFDKKIEQVQDATGSSEAYQQQRFNEVFSMEAHNDGEDSGLGPESANAGAATGVEQAAAAFSSSAGGGASGGSMRGAAPLPSGVVQPHTNYTRTYKKQYHLKLRWDVIRYLKDPDNIRAYVQYPIFEIPWEYLGFYLTSDEILELFSRYNRVTFQDCSVKIANYTAILNFDVGQAIATVGNNNVGFRAAIMKNMRGTRAGKYTQNPADVIQDVFWGIHGTSLPNSVTPTTTIAGIGAAYIARNYNLRFNHEYTPQFNELTPQLPLQYNTHWWNWMSYFEQRRNVSMNEGTWHEQSFSPNIVLDSRNFIQQAVSSQYNDDAAGYADTVFLENYDVHGQVRPKIDSGITAGTDGTRNLLAYITQAWPVRKQVPGVLIGNTYIPESVPGEATNRYALDISPGLQVYSPANYKFIRVDTELQFGIHKQRHDKMMPTCAIALEPMMTSTDTINTAIDGWMQIVLEVECSINLWGPPSYHFQQGGSGAYPLQFPPPNNYNPIYQYRAIGTNDNGDPNNINIQIVDTDQTPVEGNSRYKKMARAQLVNTVGISGNYIPTTAEKTSDYKIMTRSKAKEAKSMVTVESDEEISDEEPLPRKSHAINNKLSNVLKNRLN